ncbi:MAG: hypothetical protein NVSMB19_19090 [Vulcanimicrobiaceae bacterium]
MLADHVQHSAYVARDVRRPAAPAGTRPYPTGPFARPVVAPKIVPDSGTYIERVLGGHTHQFGKLQFSIDPLGAHDGSVPIYIAHQSDPHYRIHCRYFTHCPIEGADVAIPREARPAMNLGYTSFKDDGKHDQHLAVRNVDTGIETDMWLAPQPSGAGGTLEIGYGGSYALSSGGVGEAGATAAGFSLANGRVRAVDLLAGRIPYPLFLITPCENGHVPPAVGDDGGKDAGCPPIGARVWLDSTPAEIAATHVAPDFQTILRAMHEFGGYIGDRCTHCTLNIVREGGLTYTAFGLPDPWRAIAKRHPGEVASNGEFHIPIATGSIDAGEHLHVIAP